MHPTGTQTAAYQTADCTLPAETFQPLIKIRPTRAWRAVNFKEIWQHRELFYFLIWRELKARYKQTILGVSWVVLQPLLMTAVFTIFLGKLVRVPTGSVPYPLFVFSGLLPWSFFSNAVSSGSYSVVASSSMITKVYLPRLIIPAAAVAVRLCDFLVASLVLMILLPYYGVSFGWRLFTVPLVVATLSLLALAVSTLFSALNVKYRDTATALPVLLQLWMFCSPIVYPALLVPGRWRWFYDLNPLVGIVQGFRAALFGHAFNKGSLTMAVIVTTILLIFSLLVFRRAEDDFADIV